MKNGIKLFGIIVLAGIILLTVSCGNPSGGGPSGNSGGGSGSLTITNLPNSGRTYYVQVYNYSGWVNDIFGFFSDPVFWPRAEIRGSGTKSPIIINQKMTGTYFIYLQDGAGLATPVNQDRYWNQVQFINGEATIDFNSPDFTWDGT